ncbi:MAG: hypothetical protein J2P55_16695 [Rhizobiales bacterium]|nr:hypothetical protein [Hyphomicrobiales bacterium]
MISKSIIVFWSVVCFMLFWHMTQGHPSGAVVFMLGNGLIWAIVVVPTALIGTLFASRRPRLTPQRRRINAAILVAVGLLAWGLAYQTNSNIDRQDAQRASYTTRY